MNYYKRHIGDYAAATRHLSILEHGVYALLLDVYYGNERPLPDDVGVVARLIGARSRQEKTAVSIVLGEFFTRSDDGWRQQRCDEEIVAKNDRAEFNRTVGVRGGRPKKTQPVIEEKPSGLISETQTVTENNPSHKPLATSHKPAFAGGERASAPPPSEKTPRVSQPSRGTRIPDSFELTAELRTYAVAQGLDAERTFAKFTTYWRSRTGAGATKLNWVSTWQHWCLNEADRAPRGTVRTVEAPPVRKWRPEPGDDETAERIRVHQ